ncbi:heparin lyase I family protein [Ensifer aridi]|uniref:heparin lyase I family protein n=1 Tax=Ensifer aridi TaxID=1708715 RepID=UPI00358EFFB2
MIQTSTIVVGLCTLAGTAMAQTLVDTFDGKALDQAKWTTQQIATSQVSFPEPGRCGPAAIAASVRESDGGTACGDEDCQRAEIRTIKTSWPKFGEEVWYSFSFKAEGQVSPTGSHRLVIGQWKGPGDDSPMIAQRFDDGVFYITVQDNDIRRVVASAAEKPGETLVAQEILGKLDRDDQRTVQGIQSLQSLETMLDRQPDFARQFLSPALQKALRSTDSAPERERLAETLGLANSSLLSHFREFAFVAEPEKYIGPAAIDIISEPENRLPNPSGKWVDMVYRIKPGRMDNEKGPRRKGEVEIWANGKKIVTVRGNMGATLKKGSDLELRGPYFKFGIYRKRVAENLSLHLDEFSQAPTQSGLVKMCSVR